MKILSIKIKNLASIGEAFIDFTAEPLASAGVFAITGATGAGKSTLLDAICLALYGKTPRYDLARESGVELRDTSGSTLSQGDVKSILMDGTASGLAEVTFIGLDKQIYRAEWQVKRAREKITGKLQPETIHLYNVSTNTAFPEKKTETLAEIEKLVGLNFHQFTRSVLLAQGDFTAFLKADKDSKASLLEKLTGTEIYSEISMAVFNKCREATQELKDLTLQMEGVEILDQEKIDELVQEKKEIETSLEKISIELKNVEKDIRWYKTLEELQTQKQSAEAALKTSEEKIKEQETGRCELVLVEDMQVLKPQFDQKERIIAAIGKRKIEKNRLEETIGQLQNAIGTKAAIITTNEQNITAKKLQLKEYLPKFIEARQLDTLLLEKEKQVANALEQHQGAIQRKENQEKLLLETQRKIDELSGQIKELEIWCERNEAGKAPAENISLIQSKLKDGEGLLVTISAEHKNLDNSKTELQSAQKSLLQLGKEIDLKKTYLSGISENIRKLQEKISGTSLNNLSEKRDALNEQNTVFLKATSIWAQLLRLKESFKNEIEKLKERSIILEESERQLPLLVSQLDEARIKKEHSEKILSKSRLQLAENVESLRAQLNNGEECPVCGSLEHPFALHNPQLGKVMESLEKDAQECNDQHEEFLQKKSGLETSIKNLATQIKESEKENEKEKVLIDSLESEWNNITLDKECFELGEHKISSWLENKISLTTEEINELKKEIDFYNETKTQLDKEEEKRKNDDDKLKESGKKFSEIEWGKKTLEKTTSRYEESIEINQARMDSIFEELHPFFSKPDWTEKWQSDPALFLQNLTVFSQNWDVKNDQLKAFKEEIIPLKAKADEWRINFGVLQSEEEIREKGLNGILQEKSRFQKERQGLFGGRDVAVVEEDLQALLDQDIQKDEENKKEHSDLKNKLLTHETEFKTAVTTIDNEESELVSIQKLIEKWLLDYNKKAQGDLTFEALEKMAAKDINWIKERRDFFQKLNDSLVEAKSVFGDKNSMLTNHQASSKPNRFPEELQQKFEELNIGRETSNQRKGEIGHIFLQQENNNKRFEFLKTRLEENRTESENWNKLSDLIGSQDGKKFRRIAQEYTLDILLMHANHHLEFLSKRYVLSRIPDTLALQIQDREMGDEIRTVFSLSGGESFLVSLALALGLASLSSEKMQVESLFIDEGFGSLDPETLDMAMDALDRLHSQGRKVGVISHVQEMKERITTQIQVEKMSSGKSRVIVVN